MALSTLGQGATIAITINAIDNFSKTFKAASLGIGLVGTSMKAATIAIVAAGAALTAIGVSSLKMAASFETAFTGVRKTVELSEKGFEELENRFKDISKSTPIAFEELSLIGELAGQLGVSGVDNIEKFTKTIADISVTTNLTSDIAATAFARIANVMQLPLDQVDRMGSTIVDLGNNFATTEAEITTFSQRIAGAGKIAGLSTSEIMGIGTAMTSVGVQAEAGGTAVQKMLIKMNTAVATGNEDLSVFAATSGLTIEEFVSGWETEAGPTFAKFVEGMGAQGDGAITTLDNLGLADVRLVRSFLSLANAGTLVTDTMNVANTAWKENTALIIEAEKRYDTYDSKVKILSNSFSILMAELGDEFMPIMKELVVAITEKVIPALEPLIPILGKFFKEAIESVIPHLESMTEKFVEFVRIIMQEVIPAVLPMITLVGSLLVEAFTQVFQFIQPILPALKELATLLFDAGREILSALIPPIMDLIPILLELADIIIKNAVELVMNLLPAIQNIIPIIGDFFKSLEPLIPKLFELIEKLAEAAIEILSELIPAMSDLIPIVMDVIDIAIALIPPIVDITTAIIRLVSNILQGAAPAFTVMKDVILAIIEPIKVVIGWLVDLIDLIGNFLGMSSELNNSANATVSTVSRSSSTTTSSRSSSSGSSSRDTTRDAIDLTTSYTASSRAESTRTGLPYDGIIYLNDFIMTPQGKIIKPSSQDTIIGTKNPDNMGGGKGITIIIEGDVNGIDPEQMAEAFGRELKRAIRI